MQESVLVPDDPRLMVDGDSVHAKPVVGEILLVSVTVPVKPLWPVTVIVEVPGKVACMLRLLGLADIVKS